MLQRMTFPGFVRVAPLPRGVKPLRVVLKNDEKGNFKGTVVTVPPGKSLIAERKPGPSPTAKPTFLVSVIDAHAQNPIAAELEHTPEVLVTFTAEVLDAKKKVVSPAVHTATSPEHADVSAEGESHNAAVSALKELLAKDNKKTTPASVTAISSEYPDVKGTGPDAAAAVADLRAKLATLSEQHAMELKAQRQAAETAAKSKASPAPAGDTSKGADVPPVLDPAKAAAATQGAPSPDPDKKNPLVTREG